MRLLNYNMKKFCLLLIFILGSLTQSYAQSYVGFLTDNYSGVHGVINNPASIADSKYKLDINLAGGSGFFGNDFLGFTLQDLTNGISTLENLDSRVPSDDNNFLANVDILGPSVLYTINDKATVAFFTRARLFYNVNSINGNSLNTSDLNFDTGSGFDTQFNDTFISTHTWAEIGISYATTLINEGSHFVKGGFTFKFLKGLGNAYATSSELNVNFDPNETSEGSTTPGSVLTSGDFSYGFSENFRDNNTDIGTVSGANALGLDFGLVYELRPNRQYDNYTGFNKYKLKIGLSVTDLGSLTYNNIEESYDINNSISQQDFENIRNAADIRSLYTLQTTGQTEKAVLPTAFHFNADWNFNQKLYLNLNSDVSLTKREEENRSRVANMLTLTPRYESKWLTIQTPISIQQHSGFQMGAGFRFGPVYAGSGSIITSAFNKDSKALDVYAGVKIPFFKPTSKDRDKDGVPDKIDRCKDEYGDKDNGGCPWVDTDGDGLTDNLDDCPEIPGDKANNGCPEQTFEIQEAIDVQAKVILFNSNKTKINDVSAGALDEVVKILNEYPNIEVNIAGHADSIGSSTLNQRVSDDRANAVRNYLIQKGIDRSRLTAIGYGENKPVATNLTRKGRALNRRVEIKLLK